MSDETDARKRQLASQVAHWTIAAAGLRNLDALASPSAWNGLEQYLGVSIRRHLGGVLDRLERQGVLLQAALDSAANAAELQAARRLLIQFRAQYLRAETTLVFYTDAINTRTNPTIAGLLRACDSLAYKSMAQLLDQLGRPTPIVLTYLDKGLGASILKAGLRLWDGQSESPAAAIKIVFHNIYRATSLIHETGHQVAHVLGWNEELAAVLLEGLPHAPAEAATVCASWTSEMSADAFAFAHTGWASVLALHDVIAGDESTVLRYLPRDPHPINYLRVLLGVEMCRQFYGAGAWDGLADAWMRQYSIDRAAPRTQALLSTLLPSLPDIVRCLLCHPMRTLGGRSLASRIDPQRVSPRALGDLEQRLGTALFNSMHWVWTEALRLLALTVSRSVTTAQQAREQQLRQESWMLRLGGAQQAA